MKTRTVLCLAALSIAAATTAIDTPEATAVAGFGDVDAGAFYAEPVQWMVDNAITTGTSATCFSPDDPVTRGQAAAFLWRIEGEPAGAPGHPFTDVAADWQQEPISWMADEGITTGTSPTTYSPDATLTRGQMAALLHRAAGNPTAPTTTFPDVTRAWQLTPVGWLEQQEITTGTSPTTFSPDDPVTRGQFAAFAHRWQGAPAVTLDPSSPACGGVTPPTSTTPTSTLPIPVDAVSEIDWWGCWRAEQARDAGGATPTNGERVSSLPNCTSGPSSVGSAGDMSESGNDRPVYRPAGANGRPAIEFSYEGPGSQESTLLRTNGGSPWTGSDVLAGNRGVTVAWIGMTTDVASHTIKYVVSGLSGSSEYPQLIIEGDGTNRFQGWGGSGSLMNSSSGVITDGVIHGVIAYFGADGSIEIDNSDLRTGQNTPVNGSVAGLTLGNWYSQGFSTTDHQFVFLGLHEGRMSADDQETFWSYLSLVRNG